MCVFFSKRIITRCHCFLLYFLFVCKHDDDDNDYYYYYWQQKFQRISYTLTIMNTKQISIGYIIEVNQYESNNQ